MKLLLETLRLLAGCGIALGLLAGSATQLKAQTASVPGKVESSVSADVLQHDFFAAIKAGDAEKFLSYVSAGGVNVGPQSQHMSHEEMEQQFRAHRGLYCKLFDSSCIQAPIKLDNSVRGCSYRELLTHSEKVRTAASEVTRNGVQQAVLVAEITNNQCPDDKLIDFIFNLQADGWRLFSIP